MDSIQATTSPFPVAEQSAAVITNAAVNAEYKHLVVAADAPATDVAAGQFFHLMCPPSRGAAPFLRRPMSVYAADRELGSVEFLYKVTGAGHDAAIFANEGVPSAMIFIRNEHGSHNPSEAMALDDFLRGTDLLYHAVVEAA